YRDTNADAVNDATSQGDNNTSTNTPIQIAANPTPVPAGGDVLLLTKTASTGKPTIKASYQFSQSNNIFYPLGSASTTTPITVRGFGYTPGFSGTARRNWHFTSELRYFFQYQGGETLSFYGDDDVFVFVNGRLAVDVGGIHNQRNGRVVLGD